MGQKWDKSTMVEIIWDKNAMVEITEQMHFLGLEMSVAYRDVLFQITILVGIETTIEPIFSTMSIPR